MNLTVVQRNFPGCWHTVKGQLNIKKRNSAFIHPNKIGVLHTLLRYIYMLPKGLPIYNSFNGHVISILHVDRNYYVVYRQEYKKTKLAIVR